MTLDPTRALELAAELERCDASMTKGEYTAKGVSVYTDGRSIGYTNSSPTAKIVTELDGAQDGCEPSEFAIGRANATGIATLRNLAPEVAATIRALVAEVERVKMAARDQAGRDRALIGALENYVDQKPSRETLLAEVERMRPVVEAAVTWRETPGTDDTNSTAPWVRALTNMERAVDTYRRGKP